MDFQDCLSLQAFRFWGPSEIYFKVHRTLVFGIDVANEPRTLLGVAQPFPGFRRPCTWCQVYIKTFLSLMSRPAGPAANVLMRLKFENMKSSWVWTSLILIQTKKRARRQRARGLEATWKKKDLTQENPLLKLLTLMLSRKGFSKRGYCPLDQYIVL